MNYQDMTYADLLKWVEEQGKTEQDVFVFFADIDATCLRDMTHQELVEILLEGIRADRDHVKDYWDEGDVDQRKMYMEQMQQFWKE